MCPTVFVASLKVGWCDGQVLALDRLLGRVKKSIQPRLSPITTPVFGLLETLSFSVAFELARLQCLARLFKQRKHVVQTFKPRDGKWPVTLWLSALGKKLSSVCARPPARGSTELWTTRTVTAAPEDYNQNSFHCQCKIKHASATFWN